MAVGYRLLFAPRVSIQIIETVEINMTGHIGVRFWGDPEILKMILMKMTMLSYDYSVTAFPFRPAGRWGRSRFWIDSKASRMLHQDTMRPWCWCQPLYSREFTPSASLSRWPVSCFSDVGCFLYVLCCRNWWHPLETALIDCFCYVIIAWRNWRTGSLLVAGVRCYPSRSSYAFVLATSFCNSHNPVW